MAMRIAHQTLAKIDLTNLRKHVEAKVATKGKEVEKDELYQIRAARGEIREPVTRNDAREPLLTPGEEFMWKLQEEAATRDYKREVAQRVKNQTAYNKALTKKESEFIGHKSLLPTPAYLPTFLAKNNKV